MFIYLHCFESIINNNIEVTKHLKIHCAFILFCTIYYYENYTMTNAGFATEKEISGEKTLKRMCIFREIARNLEMKLCTMC